MSAALINSSSFLSKSVASSFFKPQRTSAPKHHVVISCKQNPVGEDNDSARSKIENGLAKVAVVAIAAAGVLTLGAVDPAAAAKSGGRVGGQAFRPSAPRSSSPRINNSRTNVYINPPIAPPLVGGYGYGYGGWGWSPFSFFAPGPSVAVGIGGGFDLILLFMVLGAVSAVFRRFFGSRGYDDDDDF